MPSSDAFKFLRTWITFFEQQKIDEFFTEDMKIFQKYFKIIKQLKKQFQKQVSIPDFFVLIKGYLDIWYTLAYNGI